MRTSKIARDTSKVVAALSSRRTSTRRTASSSIPAPIETSLSDSELSSTPSDLEDGSFPEPTGSASRKRKRGADTPGKTAATVIKQEATTRRSSRKSNGRDQADDATIANGKPQKAKRQPAKKITDASGDVKVEPPPNWEEVYTLTAQMRSQVLAPVDTMGCESLAEETRSPRDQRFQTLVALMLSSQTKDTVTSVAMKNLQDNLPGGFNLESILAVEPDTLNSMISKVGFHNLKTKYIKSAAKILVEKHGSDIPDTIEGLVALPGVGPKMAYLCMSAAWGRDEGIGVDVHVHRITNLWGWHKTKTPEETRAALEAWLPREKWHDINHLLVGFGQTICAPVGRKCGECVLSERGLCPSAVVQKEVKKRVKKEVVKREDGNEVVVKEETEIDETDFTADGRKERVVDIEDVISAPSRRPSRKL